MVVLRVLGFPGGQVHEGERLRWARAPKPPGDAAGGPAAPAGEEGPPWPFSTSPFGLLRHLVK